MAAILPYFSFFLSSLYFAAATLRSPKHARPHARTPLHPPSITYPFRRIQRDHKAQQYQAMTSCGGPPLFILDSPPTFPRGRRGKGLRPAYIGDWCCDAMFLECRLSVFLYCLLLSSFVFFCHGTLLLCLVVPFSS